MDGHDGRSYDGPTSRKPSLRTPRKPSFVELRSDAERKIGLGIKYPPLPKWMVRPLPPAQKVTSTATTTPIAGAGRGNEKRKVIVDAGNEADDEGRGRMPRWMEMLPGNRRGGRGKGEGGRGAERRRRGVVSGGVRKGVALERRVGSRGGGFGREIGRGMR